MKTERHPEEEITSAHVVERLKASADLHSGKLGQSLEKRFKEEVPGVVPVHSETFLSAVGGFTRKSRLAVVCAIIETLRDRSQQSGLSRGKNTETGSAS